MCPRRSGFRFLVLDDPRQDGEPTDEQKAASAKWYEAVADGRKRIIVHSRVNTADLLGPTAEGQPDGQ